MKKIIFLALLSLGIITVASAQWSVGARFGGATGVSLKHYPVNGGGLLFESISAVNFDNALDGFSETLLLQKFGPLSGDNKLGAILGGGETMIFGNDFLFGVSGILGFDWRIGRIGFQLDWMPTWIFVNESYFSPVNVAITGRWIFGGRLNTK